MSHHPPTLFRLSDSLSEWHQPLAYHCTCLTHSPITTRSEFLRKPLALEPDVLLGPLLRSRILCESRAAAERTCKSTVLDLDDAHIRRTADGSRALHACRHLNLDGEVGGSGAAKTTYANAGNVLNHLRSLEG